MPRPVRTAVLAALTILIGARPSAAQSGVSPAEARAIAKEAYVYGFPLVDNYRIIHGYFVNTKSPEYKGAWNAVHSAARVYTPADKAVQTPNSDTPYSMIAFDLRAEPIVLTLPAIEKGRYYSVQLIDAYTFNFNYLGTRTTGNGGGNFLIAGPEWKGEAPKGIAKVVRSETNVALGIIRTQLFNPADLPNVVKLQGGYKAQPLSAFLGKSAPKPVPPLKFPTPLTPQTELTSPEFYDIMAFMMGMGPEPASEKALRARFAKLGIVAGKPFDPAKLTPAVRQAVQDGMGDAQKAFGDFERTDLATGKVTSGDLFGTREYLKDNWMYRMGAAKLGIYGNSKDEAIYPFYRIDAKGQSLDGSKAKYTLRFAPGQLPPVDAFWSLTMYTMPASLLYANPINRYLINSPMLPNLKKDADGGLTLYVQNASPGKERESNWLPAPAGPFAMALRLYLPKAEALDGRWKQPPLTSTPK